MIDELTDTSNLTKEQRDMVIKNYDETKKFFQMQKLKNYDLLLEDVSYVFLPIGRIAVRDAWNFKFSNATMNNQLIVNYLENMPLDHFSPTCIGLSEGIKAIYEHLEYKFSNHKSVPK
jgi:hypothetical protein